MVAHICSSRTLTDRRKMETGELLGALRPVSLMYASGDNRDPFSNKAEVRANVQNCSLISTCTHTHTHIITRKRHHGPHHQVPKELSAELGTRFITSPLISRRGSVEWGQSLCKHQVPVRPSAHTRLTASGRSIL